MAEFQLSCRCVLGPTEIPQWESPGNERPSGGVADGHAPILSRDWLPLKPARGVPWGGGCEGGGHGLDTEWLSRSRKMAD